MILYKDWGKHLRWGNFGMLYMNLLSIARRTGNELVLPDYFAWQYLKYPPKIDTGLPVDEVFHFRQTNYTPEEEAYILDYFSKNKDRNININLGSNLQSELWSKCDINYVIEQMRFNKEALNTVVQKYDHLFSAGKQVIGIGVRRGDFVGHGCFYQIPTSWYLDALKAEFPNWERANIVFFSDDIEECKTLFKGENFFFAEPNGTHTHAENFKYYHQDPMEQFILGTLCDDFVGGSSTFSWMQMWYIHNKGGKVVHSGRNLAEQCLKDFYNPDYYPKDWTLHPINE